MQEDQAAWPVGLVGEQHHVASIDSCAVGDRVLFVREIGNPYDDEAVAAINEASRRIGYVARDHWLRDAIIEDGRNFAGTILSIESGQRSFKQVVIMASPAPVKTLNLPYAQLQALVDAI